MSIRKANKVFFDFMLTLRIRIKGLFAPSANIQRKQDLKSNEPILTYSHQGYKDREPVGRCFFL